MMYEIFFKISSCYQNLNTKCTIQEIICLKIEQYDKEVIVLTIIKY